MVKQKQNKKKLPFFLLLNVLFSILNHGTRQSVANIQVFEYIHEYFL